MWRNVGAGLLVTVGILAGKADAQTVHLSEGPLAKSCFRNDLSMDLTGKITVQQEGKNITLKQAASARHVFVEKILEAKDGLAEKSARIYQAAEAAITIESEVAKRALRPELALMIAQRSREGTAVYSPQGLLSNDEKELTEHFDTLALPGLLPNKDTAVGATWTIPTPVTLALCDVDGVVSGGLTGKLLAIQGDVATGTVEGIVKAIGMGAQVSMEIKARFAFELKEKRLVALEWSQHDERQQGPINPALTADVTYKLKRTPIIEPNALNDIALVRALSVPADKMSAVHYRDPKGRFDLQYARNWHLVSQDEKHLVLRLLSERGDFIAQATLTPYTKVEPGKMMDIDEFVSLMAAAPGWEQEDGLVEKTSKVEAGEDGAHQIYRVGATGKLGGVSALQYFHLIAGAGGDQVIVTFTMDPKQAPNLSSHDLAFLRGIAFPRVAAK